MSQAYDPDLRRLAHQVAAEEDVPLHEGVYAGLSGPSFETPAEIRFLRLIGADAVGMSTTPEVTVARHGRIRAMGVSGISNVAIDEPTGGQEASHEEVLEAGRQVVPRLTRLLCGVLARLPE
jgi:purine-nucleoside phosphorylase